MNVLFRRLSLLFILAAQLIVAGQLLSKAVPKSNQEPAVKICGDLYIRLSEGEENQSFSDNEKILLCGSNTPGWKSIPEWQTKEVLNGLLASRGYYQSTYIYEKDKIIAVTGSKTHVESISFGNTPPHFYDTKFLRVKGQVLNSKSLDELEAWTIARLKALGYACPNLSIKASALTGDINVEISTGDLSIIKKIDRSNNANLRANSLSRFDAFLLGDPYNGDLLELTSRRIASAGIADYTRFKHACTAERQPPTDFIQEFSFGKPVRLSVAFGASTEELPIAKLSWVHTRLDRDASSTYFQLYLSPIEQSLKSRSNFFWYNSLPRLYTFIDLSSQRFSEDFYTSIKHEAAIGFGYDLDDSHNRYSLEVSPLYRVEDTLEGSGPRSNTQLSFKTSFGIISHKFEYHQSDPRAGFQLGGDWSVQSANIKASRYRIWGTYLHDWGGFDPPLWIFGMRFALSTLKSNQLQEISTSFRLYLGGDANMRGFSRKSINNNEQGFRTTSYIGSEVRLANILPYRLQPYFLLDFAQTGRNDFQLDTDMYLSPGLGLRWQSPIGPIRATAALGVTNNESSDAYEKWVFFLSLGQEF